MNKDLADCLAWAAKLVEVKVDWGGTMPLKLAYYVQDVLPPARYISSVRALVFRGGDVLVVEEPNGHLHILPGGRIEKGERPVETLKREILEETGWSVEPTAVLGFMHFQHLAPRRPGYPYPYPDFVWPVYVAEAGEFLPGAMQPDDYVSGSSFCSVDSARKLPLDKGESMFLDAAMALRELQE